MEDLDIDKVAKTAEEMTNLDNTSAPLASGTDRSVSGDPLKDMQDKGVIGAVIGQVCAVHVRAMLTFSVNNSFIKLKVNMHAVSSK